MFYRIYRIDALEREKPPTKRVFSSAVEKQCKRGAHRTHRMDDSYMIPMIGAI